MLEIIYLIMKHDTTTRQSWNLPWIQRSGGTEGILLEDSGVDGWWRKATMDVLS